MTDSPWAIVDLLAEHGGVVLVALGPRVPATERRLLLLGQLATGQQCWPDSWPGAKEGSPRASPLIGILRGAPDS